MKSQCGIAEEHETNREAVAEVGSHFTAVRATKCGTTATDAFIVALGELGKHVAPCWVEEVGMTSIEADRSSCGKLGCFAADDSAGAPPAKAWAP